MERLAIACLLGLAMTPFGVAGDESGFIQRISDGHFLTCSTDACSWQPSPTQIFRKDLGDDGQYRFHILQADGTDTQQCLDRHHCHFDTSETRAGSCDHCGATRWGYDGSQLAEDDMKNCLQSNGGVAHCSSSHESIKWPVAQDCKPTATTITDVQCKGKQPNGVCGANFDKGSVTAAHSDDNCDACKAATGSTTQCSFQFTVATQHSVSTTFGSDTAIMGGTSFSMGMTFIAKGEGDVSFSVSKTLTYGQTESTASESSVGGDCTVSINAGTAESAVANYFTGTLMGDFTAKVTTTYDCPWKDPEVKQTSGTITITNVPTRSMNGSCTTVAEKCPGAVLHV